MKKVEVEVEVEVEVKVALIPPRWDEGIGLYGLQSATNPLAERSRSQRDTSW